jgi:hypothetical protein
MTTHDHTTRAFGSTTANGTPGRNRGRRRRLTRTEVVFRTASGGSLIANAPPGVRPALRARARRAR